MRQSLTNYRELGSFCAGKTIQFTIFTLSIIPTAHFMPSVDLLLFPFHHNIKTWNVKFCNAPCNFLLTEQIEQLAQVHSKVWSMRIGLESTTQPCPEFMSARQTEKAFLCNSKTWRRVSIRNYTNYVKTVSTDHYTALMVMWMEFQWKKMNNE